MTPRTTRQILEDWRAAERELDEATDDELREVIEARIAALAAEHADALTELSSNAESLGSPPFASSAEA